MKQIYFTLSLAFGAMALTNTAGAQGFAFNTSGPVLPDVPKGIRKCQ